MTVTTPTAAPVTAQAALIGPALDVEPLKSMLEGLNYLYEYHRPPLVNVRYLCGSAYTRNTVFEIPVSPSADSIRYDIVHRWYSAAAGSMTITVEEYDGLSWTTAYTSSAITTSATTWHSHSHNTTLPSDAIRLRVTYAHGVNSYYPCHILAYPSPGTTPTVIQSSGWEPFDDGLLGGGEAPIHTELLNRAKASALAVLRDRVHMVASLVQETTIANVSYDGVVLTGGSNVMTVGRAVASLPGQTGLSKLQVRCKGYTDKASPSGYAIRLRQVGTVHDNNSVEFDVDNVADDWQSGTMVVHGESPDLEVIVLNPSSAGTQTCVCAALVAWWDPGDPA